METSLAYHSANHCIQPGAIASAGQNPNFHCLLLNGYGFFGSSLPMAKFKSTPDTLQLHLLATDG
jgi:hypothetical protein